LFFQINDLFELNGNPMKGNSFEGFAIEQIIQQINPAYQAFFYRTHHGAECDLIITRASKPHFAIEIKYSSSPKLTKGNMIAFEDIGAKHNFIITPDTDDYLINKTVRVCSLQIFLEKYINMGTTASLWKNK